MGRLETHLGFDVQKTSTTALLYLVYGHEGGAVIVAGELGVLDEGIASRLPFTRTRLVKEEVELGYLSVFREDR